MVKRTIAIIILAALPIVIGCAGSRNIGMEPARPEEPNRDLALRHVAELKNGTFQSVTARLRLGIDTAHAFHQLDSL
ncbi:MAG: hypothetical protein ABI876_09555, partial [Bacteroidota bacterium]